MNITMVLTCGTSLLTNIINNQGENANTLRQLVRDTTNEKDLSSLTPGQQVQVQWLLKESEKQMETADITDAHKLSAELNGLLAYYQDQLDQASKNIHFLLCSDTFLGQSCAELAKKWMESQGLHAEIHRVQDLNTKEPDCFNTAMADLTKWCSEHIAPLNGVSKVVFNLVGGFKAFLGFMQALGMLYADETVYMFEGSTKLLKLPKLPLDLDSGISKAIRDHLPALRLLSKDLPCTPEQCQSIPEVLLLNIDGQYTLSSWGEVLFQKFQAQHYGDAVLESPLPERIRYSEKFRRSLEVPTMKDQQHKKQLNERIDDLARFLITGDNPKRLDLKALKGKVLKSGATHEIDLWSTSGGWRLFCHFEGNICVLDEIHSHLDSANSY